MNLTSKFRPFQDQYAQKTGRTWTNENPSAVRPDTSDFKRLRSVSGGPRTHTEVSFTVYKIYRNSFFWEGLMGLKWNCLMDRVTYCDMCAWNVKSCFWMSQRAFHHWRQRRPEADHHERSSSGKICGWDSPAGPGLPVHRQTWRRYRQ